MPESLIPLRFMSLLGHFVITVVMICSRTELVKVCVDWDQPESLSEQMQSKNAEMIAALSMTVAFVSVELVCFLTGVSMFYPFHSFISLLCHSMASVALGIFLMDGWECGLVWWSFALFTLLPVTSELIIFSSVIFFKRPF